MNRLTVRLVVSHLLVAAVGAAATFLLVRILAPQALDRRMRGLGGGPGTGRMMREQFVAAVDSALLVGVGVGALAAAAIGAAAAYRLARPLERLSSATREMASGRYDVDVPAPGTRELDDLADGVRSLGASLRETEERRVRLLGEVAHEMRTPLTVVDGYVEGMIDGILPADDETLALVSGELRRLRRLSDDLSSLSRAEEGRLDLAVRETDLTEVVRQAAERLRPQAEDAGVELLVRVGGAPLRAEVDGCGAGLRALLPGAGPTAARAGVRRRGLRNRPDRLPADRGRARRHADRWKRGPGTGCDLHADPSPTPCFTLLTGT